MNNYALKLEENMQNNVKYPPYFDPLRGAK
jgi:hypothetical protein